MSARPMSPREWERWHSGVSCGHGRGCACYLGRRLDELARRESIRRGKPNQETEIAVAPSSEVAVRNSLRKLEEARAVAKWARMQLTAAITTVLLTIGLWTAQLMTDYDGAGYGWKVVGLIVLLLASLAWTGFSAVFSFAKAKERRIAGYGHEDALIAYGDSSGGLA